MMILQAECEESILSTVFGWPDEKSSVVHCRENKGLTNDETSKIFKLLSLQFLNKDSAWRRSTWKNQAYLGASESVEVLILRGLCTGLLSCGVDGNRGLRVGHGDAVRLRKKGPAKTKRKVWITLNERWWRWKTNTWFTRGRTRLTKRSNSPGKSRHRWWWVSWWRMWFGCKNKI